MPIPNINILRERSAYFNSDAVSNYLKPKMKVVEKVKSNSASGIAIQVQNLSKSFGDIKVLENLNLDIKPGAFVAIVGRSGCGKSTLLRLISGLDQAEVGSISYDGNPHSSINGDARFMFQEARLLPWQSVINNVRLGLKKTDFPKALNALQQVGLDARADVWPSVLSGGQRQRVALARSLVHEPRLLLLDEPLGALDALTRIEMQGLIEKLWREHGFTAILVTHDIFEAVSLADRVILLNDGKIDLDINIDLPRPRQRSDVELNRLGEEILQRILTRPVAS
ncbi:MAG: ATP-binding cassette domain-containing protein [Methylococcales bacterium]|nr:ATP-binding cassette domain-containing protein [Methylococcales bacterium]